LFVTQLFSNFIIALKIHDTATMSFSPSDLQEELEFSLNVNAGSECSGGLEP